MTVLITIGTKQPTTIPITSHICHQQTSNGQAQEDPQYYCKIGIYKTTEDTEGNFLCIKLLSVMWSTIIDIWANRDNPVRIYG
jgi:hypothetical protein